jgi:hypothetical protein
MWYFQISKHLSHYPEVQMMLKDCTTLAELHDAMMKTGGRMTYANFNEFIEVLVRLGVSVETIAELAKVKRATVVRWKRTLKQAPHNRRRKEVVRLLCSHIALPKP